MKKLCVAALAVVILAGCGEPTDASGKRACRHFRNTARDYSNGLLTFGELRTKLQEVHRDAQYAKTPSIRTSSAAMLSSITSGDPDGLASAITSMGNACRSKGF